MAKFSRDLACPCGGERYVQCCERFILGAEIPQTARDLMRSRFSAYAMRDEAYLRATWYASSRPEKVLEPDDGMKWLSLEIRFSEQDDNWGKVEFVARYKINGRAGRLHEISRFVREEGRWFYLDGDFPKEHAK